MIKFVQVFLIALIKSWVQSDFEHLYVFRHTVSEKEAAPFTLDGNLIHKLENRFSMEL